MVNHFKVQVVTPICIVVCFSFLLSINQTTFSQQFVMYDNPDIGIQMKVPYDWKISQLGEPNIDGEYYEIDSRHPNGIQ
jgi:hypothetical protein